MTLVRSWYVDLAQFAIRTVEKKKMIIIRHPTTSNVSRIVQILIKARFLPLELNHDEQKISFRFWSFNTLTFFLVYWGILLGVYLLGQVASQNINHVIEDYFESSNIIDSISLMLFGTLLTMIFPFCPLFVANGAPSASSLALATDLKWPRHGGKYLLSFLLSCTGSMLINISFFSHMLDGVNVSSQVSAVIYVTPLLQHLLASLYWLIPTLLLSTWVEKFIFLCKSEASEEKIKHARKCIEFYTAIESGFGTFFCFVYGVTQVLLIFAFFVAISRALGGNEPLTVKVVASLGTLLVCSGLMLNIAALTFVLEEAYKCVTSLVKPLQDQLLISVSERRRLKKVIREIENLGPLTGNGYFSITRGVLTSMVSIGITYIIILVQFKMSAS